jgi:hypothetical protein
VKPPLQDLELALTRARPADAGTAAFNWIEGIGRFRFAVLRATCGFPRRFLRHNARDFDSTGATIPAHPTALEGTAGGEVRGTSI